MLLVNEATTLLLHVAGSVFKVLVWDLAQDLFQVIYSK